MALNKEQQAYILDAVKLGFEYGLENDEDKFKRELQEEGSLFEGQVEEAAEWYSELVNYGPAGFYEEYPDLDWDEDFISEYGEY